MQFAQTVLADVKAGAAHKESQLRVCASRIRYNGSMLCYCIGC